MTDDIAKIAKGLSEAQRRALLGIPVKRDFKPETTGFQWSTLAILKSRRLINGLADGFGGMGKSALHRITSLGLSVRQYLMENHDE